MKALEKAKAFVEGRQQAIDDLLADRKRLQDSIGQIDTLLRELGWRKKSSVAAETNTGKILIELKKEPGSTVADLCAVMELPSNHVSAACSRLLSDGRITRKGRRGSFSYFAADEEEDDDDDDEDEDDEPELVRSAATFLGKRKQ